MKSKVVSDRVEIHIDSSPAIASILNRQTGNVVCQGGRLDMLVRLPTQISDPEFLDRVTLVDQSSSGAGFAFSNESGDYRGRIDVHADADGLRFHVTASAPEPIWMVEWTLHGLKLEEVIIPALGGRCVNLNMPRGVVLSYNYPHWWNAQFVIGSSGTGRGGVWLCAKDTQPRIKLLRVQKEDRDHFALTFGFKGDAPLVATDLEADWYLDGYAGDWTEAADRHSSWLEGAFDLVPYYEHPHYPRWVDEINFFLELWCAHRSIRSGHRFDEVATRIEEFARLHPPKQTLIYLPGFAETGIDSNIPDYNPSPKLGGADGFKKLVDRAHELGYRVMVHTNILGMAYSHPLYSEFRSTHIKDEFGRRQAWENDVDGDWIPEPYFAYMNPGEKAWGDVFESIVRTMVTEFEVDAVHLDQTLLSFNVSNGPNFLDGMRGLVERLQKAFPQTYFQGEGIHELILPAMPAAQIHGVDSLHTLARMYLSASHRSRILARMILRLAQISGFKRAVPWYKLHPVSIRVFGKYTRLVPHLLTDHPSGSRFNYQEEAYSQLGIPPTLVCYESIQSSDGSSVRKMLKRAKNLHNEVLATRNQ